MSKYYNPQRTRNLFDPSSKKPYKISRADIELFLKCPRCFYFHKRLGTPTPPTYPYTLNSAVDKLLKREYDIFRRLRLPHPNMTYHGIKCIPFAHKDLEIWRDPLRGGIRYLHAPTNLEIRGAIDDVWIDANDELHVVDFKSTARKGDVNIEADWQISFRRQLEIYQWIFRRNGFRVSDKAYIVYANADTSRTAFESKLEFDVCIIPYKGSDSWIEDVIVRLHECLLSPDLPPPGRDCDYCAYFDRRTLHEKNVRRSPVAKSSDRNSTLN